MNFAACFIVIIMVGCATATVGKDFTRIPDNALTLGKTTYYDIVKRHGEITLKEVRKNDFVLKMGSYSLAKANVNNELIPQKSQNFWFYNDILVGYNYNNSFEGDRTDFDSELRAKIKIGESSINDVIHLLGPPTGKSIYPLAKNTEDLIIEYGYFQAKQKPMRYYIKNLKFTTNKLGLVTNIDFSESGDK